MYKFHLDKFLEFTKIKDYDSLVGLDSDTIQMLLENFVIYLKGKNLKAKSIRNYLNGIELFFDVNKKTYFKRVLRKMIPEDTKEGNDQPYTTEDVQKMLDATNSKRMKALIHFFASTGARPNVLNDPVLRLKHLYPMPFGCKAVKMYESTRSEFWGFLTPEAVLALDEYFAERQQQEYLTSESPVFANKVRVKNQKASPLTHNNINSMMFRILKVTGIERIKVGNRFDKALYYGLRKRFNGILKMNNNVNSNIAEKLMAHKKGLDGVYLKPTREQCFSEFQKAIQDLTISDKSRNKIVMEKQEAKITELETKQAEIDFMKEQIKGLYELLGKD